MSSTDEYAISVAKTEYREGYNTADVTFYGAVGKESLHIQAPKLFEEYSVKIEIIMIGIIVFGDVACDHGCHKLTLTPKRGGKAESRSHRYCERWRRRSDGCWKLEFFISNKDLEPQMLAP